MKQNIELKTIVMQKYSDIVSDESSCCGPTARQKADDCCTSMSEDYSKLGGYMKDADYSLGCGVPTEYAEINAGDTVLDLGSGAGNDVFVVQNIVGSEGSVVGLDFTQEMIDKATQNKQKLGLTNVEFKLGDIENIPVADAEVDVVISNCVLNLVPDKKKAFSEIYRVLKPGAHFCISDIVSEGRLPEQLKTSAELYAGCVAGAIPKEEYLGIAEQAGFENLEIRKERPIEIPEETVRESLSDKEWAAWNKGGIGTFSITLFAKKPV